MTASPMVNRLLIGLLALLAFVPLYAQWAGEPFLITFLSRVLIFALAALSLNIILGFGGLVSTRDKNVMRKGSSAHCA